MGCYLCAPMRIAVNTRFGWLERLEGYGYFTEQVFLRLAEQHSEHAFLFIFDRPVDPVLSWPSNVKICVVGPPARHPLLWRLWYNWRIPGVLSRFKADVFVSPDGIASLCTRVPQCLVVHDLAFLHDRDWFSASIRRYYRVHLPKFLKTVKTIATVSEKSRAELIDRYQIAPDRIDVVYSAAKSAFRILSEQERADIKLRFTEGKEYFLYTGAIHPRKNLIGLLKAFSLFKKRQQNGFKLVLAGRMAWQSGRFEALLSTYKYRNDVVLTGYVDLETLVGLTGSAYALVYPSFYEGFGVPVLESMQAGVPVITSSDTSMEEIAGSAALYADPKDPASIAEQMNRLYIDEALRRRQIEAGKPVAARFQWSATAERVWDCMLKAAHSN